MSTGINSNMVAPRFLSGHPEPLEPWGGGQADGAIEATGRVNHVPDGASRAIEACVNTMHR